MKKLKFLMVLFLVISTLIGARTSSAYDFPIPELGNCQNQRECHLFCEIPKNHAACWSYSTYQHQVLGDESPEQKLSPLGIVFPISILGNCPNLSACKAYCEADEHIAECQAFAKNSGLVGQEKILEKAGEELGCTTKQECKMYCAQAENGKVCTAFSRRYNLKGTIKDQLLTEARKTLGCRSVAECRAYCAKKENRNKCQILGKKLNTSDQIKREELVEAAKQELGCTSFEDCKTYCQNEANKETCRNFGQKVSEGARLRNLQNKGVCNTVAECKKVCSESPETCPAFPERSTDLPGNFEIKNPRPQEELKQRPIELKRKVENTPL